MSRADQRPFSTAASGRRCTAARGRGRLCHLAAAFTLVELLLVIAIMAVLLALLVPLGAQVLALARSLQCQNNLRELHKCISQYYLDHGDVFPPMRSLGRSDAQLREIADDARLALNDAPNAGGYHWSLIIWPYHRSLKLYTCPCDPNADGRGDLTGGGLKLGSPFADAPPESYGLNTLLFRMTPPLRKMAGASWGLAANEFVSDLTFTTRNEQKQQIPRLERRILLFCGAAGCTVGHQSNTVWRDAGLPGVQRYEWHPWPGPKAFEDAKTFGSNYLFWDGAVEYRQDFPSRFEWALDLK
jgi:prepilin-type N-terminal cleavage/methylation domain-containing protein/prepilin-type processing-associated H-X9-DG protein